MAKKLDKILIVDIEATCWEGALPEGMANDIIEIGICLLDVSTGEITDNRGSSHSLASCECEFVWRPAIIYINQPEAYQYAHSQDASECGGYF